MPTADDRLFVWMLVKNLDTPRHQVERMLEDLGVPIYITAERNPFVSRSMLRDRLFEVVGN